jgi:hypothetical protein
MKLNTSIAPRRDGTVKASGPSGQTYVFTLDEDGELACDVADEMDLAALLETDNFYPADPADAERAADLVAAEDDEPAESEDEDMGGLPIEAETPPVAKRTRKAK